MKVLHIIDSGGLYGAEIMLLNLAKEQIRLGIHSVIGSIGELNIEAKPLEVEARKRNLEIKLFRMNPGMNIRGIQSILDYIREGGFDLIHTHGYKGNVLLGFIPRKIRKFPIISTVHGYTGMKLFSKMTVYELLDTISHRFIDRAVLVNCAMLKKFRNSIRTGVRYSVVNNGIDLNHSPMIYESSFNKEIESFSMNSFTIGSIGRLSKEKGFEYLIHALKRMKESGVDAKLVLIGDGPERTNLEKLVSICGLTERVFFTGYLENAMQYISNFDAYVISSLTEGLPITLLESMLAKTPVVSTNVGGIPDVIRNEKEGLLVPSCQSEILSNAITRIYEDRNLAERLVKNAYERIHEHYSSKKMAMEYLAIYKELMHFK
jgi:glycosyltransferase involved in cell wall biosynthesis